MSLICFHQHSQNCINFVRFNLDYLRPVGLLDKVCCFDYTHFSDHERKIELKKS